MQNSPGARLLLCSTISMRLFVALDIEQQVRNRIHNFMEEIRGLAPGVRWVSPESLHVTLKFIGEQPDANVSNLEGALRTVIAPSFQVTFRGSGFFPTEKSARVFWTGIEAGPALVELAARVEQALIPLGIAPEKRAFSPHLTLARAGGGSGAPGPQREDKPNLRFSALQAKLSTLPASEFGTMNAAEFLLYRSQLSNGGAQYTKIARFALNP
jgi:RNA 2',3'-cyclic 3'-phosphodiesterase